MSIPEQHKIGDLVALKGYMGRKIAVIVGYGSSRRPFDYCIRVWRHNSRKWTAERLTNRFEIAGYAPEDWPQTKTARNVGLKAEGRA